MPTITIQTVNAPVGSGKTFAASGYSINAARSGQKILIVQPSKILIKQTYRDLVARDPEVKATKFHGEDDHTEVVEAIYAHLKLAEGSNVGEIVIISHSAFDRLLYIPARNSWHIIYDEMPAVAFYREYKLAENGNIVLDMIETADSNHPAYLKINATWKFAKLSNVARNAHGDEVWKIVADLAARLDSSHWDMFVQDEQFERFRGNGDRATKSTLAVYGLQSPTIFEGFASVTLMSACLTQSICYRYWSLPNLPTRVEFVAHPTIKPRFEQHANSHLLDIFYVTDHAWSKRLRDKKFDGSDQTVLDAVVARTVDLMAGEPFVYLANLDRDGVFGQSGTQLPNSPHGLNNFQHVHNACIVSALNPAPAHFEFLREVAGIEPDATGDAIYRAAVYQAAGRISIRDTASNDRKKIVVMDAITADWLLTLFPDATVQPLPGAPSAGFPAPKATGRPRIHATGADKVAAHRAEKYDRLIAGLKEVNLSSSELILWKLQNCFKAVSNERPIKRSFVTDEFSHYGSMFASIYENFALPTSLPSTTTGLLSLLEDRSAMTFADKHKNTLITPSLFDPSRSEETDRGLANIVSIRGVWLDNDNNDGDDECEGRGISYEEFAGLFPTIRMVVYNTHSSTPELPRYRVFIPTDKYITIEVYKEIIGVIKNRLTRKKWYGKEHLKKHPEKVGVDRRHGFDESKFTPSSMFYLPCQAGHPDGSFYVDYDDAKRVILDPFRILGGAISQDRPEPVPVYVPPPVVLDDQGNPVPKTVSETKVDAAIDAWRSLPSGEGNAGLYRLACQLFGLGLDEFEVTSTLQTEVYHSRSPQDRRKEIKNAVLNAGRFVGSRRA